MKIKIVIFTGEIKNTSGILLPYEWKTHLLPMVLIIIFINPNSRGKKLYPVTFRNDFRHLTSYLTCLKFLCQKVGGYVEENVTQS